MKKIIPFLFLAQSLSFMAFSQVGIGTLSPNTSSILELKSSNKGLLFPRTSTTTRLTMTGAKGLMIYDTTLNLFYYHSGSSWLQIPSGPHPIVRWGLSQWDDATLYNLTSGNVSIGTDVPSNYKLFVNGTLYVSHVDKSTLRVGGVPSTTEARIIWDLPSNSMDYNITQNLNHLYISRTTGAAGFTSDMVVDPNGFVGIGTSDPQTKFNIQNGSDVGNASGGFIQLGHTSELNIGIDNNEIQARNNGAVYRLHLNNGGGTVQIGNAIAPTTYSLAVNGKVICEELKIQASSNWADYVFADNYSLRSFDELRKYISVNHHLPNIPDAKTVETEGIVVGDMQRRMMEKIEELTLYILQLEEKSRAHDKEIELLKAGRS